MPEIDVPEDFDLHEALHQRSTTPSEKRPRCPECRSANLRSKTGKWEIDNAREEEYYCSQCYTHFDEPVYGAGGEPQ